MRRILTVVMRTKTMPDISLARAPKKGKQEAQVATSNDLINIFKDRQDPEMKPIDEYPVWLLELALPLLTHESAYPAFIQNDPYFSPDVHNIRHLVRNSAKLNLKERNQYQLIKKSVDDAYYMDDFNFENAVDARREELAQLEKQKAIEEEAKSANNDDDDDDEEGAKKPTRVFVDKEKEKADEEEFKAKLYAKKR